MTTISESPRTFVPGMGLDWLLPLYDPFTRLLGLQGTRQELVAQAELQPRARVLDIGCGTGSLAVLIKQQHPTVEVVALDPDGKALDRARRKAQRAGVAIQFDQGFADTLPYATASFDRVFSSFMFHHLERTDKVRMLAEIARVLKKGGRLHLVDFGGAHDDGHGHVLHSHARLRDNAEKTVVALMTDAGLADAGRTADRRLFGDLMRIAYYQAGGPLR